MNFPTRTRSDELLVIIKDGHEYTLPVGWAIADSGNYEFRNKLEEKVYSHGSDMVGDGKIDGRTLQIEFDIQGATEIEHDEILNLAYTYLCMTDYDLYAGRSDRLYHVAGPSKITHEFREGFKQRWSTVKAALLLADPFRYEATESKASETFDEYINDGVIILNNEGSVDTPLTFTFTPSFGGIGTVTVVHEESGEKFTLSDALLIPPSVGIVNGKEGTVWRDNNNSINTFSGQFLKAEPGENTFYYTGGAATVEITYTNRWFV